MSHQAVLEKMHRSSLTASQYLCLTSPFHRKIFELNTMQVCPPGLHIMLGIFTKMFHWLEALCCQLDLELASHTTDFDSINFSRYSQALQRLPLLQEDHETAFTGRGSNICGLSSWRGKPSCCGSFEAIWYKKETSEGTCTVHHYATCTIVFKLVQYRKQKWRNAQQL